MSDDHGKTTEPESEPLVFGPYRTQHVLGEGGMGVVYEAAHVDTREVVALKTVKRHDGIGSYLDTVRREIRELRRLDHPGIVRVVDGGETDGMPWVAMRCLRGRTLRDSLERARTNLGWTLTLFRRLCAPLAYLHGEGLVHRDLKPENIFLENEDDRPVLVDLGISVPFGRRSGREELDIEQPMGTRLYMAPEQICGELVDARADLYSLGCILYEYVTGHRPFEGATTQSILLQHVHDPPVPPSDVIRGLPRGLDDLILALLEKKPENRLGYAALVAERLVALGAHEEPFDEGPRPGTYLYRPQLLGREQERKVIERAVRRVIVERMGGLVIVDGESGMGKTRLVKEVGPIAARLDQHPRMLTLVTSPCAPPVAKENGSTISVATPFEPLRPLLRAAADWVRHSKAEADRVFGPSGRILARYEPSLLELPGQAAQPEPKKLPPDRARARAIASMFLVLRALSEIKPVLLVLDDIQWADDLTLGLLSELAKRDPQKNGVLVIATYRPEETSEAHDALVRIEGVEKITLPRLSRPDVHDLVVGMLAQPTPPPAALEALAGHANGNPFFVAQYLFAAVEEGILRQDKAGRFCFDAPGSGDAVAALPLPSTVEALITRRLDRLDAAGEALTAWAAVLGEELTAELLLSNEKPAPTTESLDTLLRRGILEVTHLGALGFAHDKLRVIAYRRMAPESRVALHLRAGKALEERFGRMRNKQAVLGYHFLNAGLHEKASRHFARAAAHAREIDAAEAIHLYRAAIDALGFVADGEGRRATLATLHERMGDMLTLVGRREEAQAAYTWAQDTTPAASIVDRARLRRKVGNTWQILEAYDAALALYDEAEEALREGPRTKAWWNEWLRIQLDRFSVHYRRPDRATIDALHRMIEPAVEQWGTAKVRAHYFGARVQYDLHCNRFVASPDTVRYVRKCNAAARQARDAQDLLAARCDLGIVYWLRGRLDKAENQMLEVFDAAKRSSDLLIEARSATYLGVISRRRRNMDEVEKHAREGLRLAIEASKNDYVAVSRGNLAWIALRRGQLMEAEEAALEALRLWGESKIGFPFQWVARVPLLAVRFSQGDLEGALEQARAMLAPSQHRLPNRLEAALESAQKDFADGDAARAETSLREALRIARKLGYA